MLATRTFHASASIAILALLPFGCGEGTLQGSIDESDEAYYQQGTATCGVDATYVIDDIYSSVSTAYRNLTYDPWWFWESESDSRRKLCRDFGLNWDISQFAFAEGVNGGSSKTRSTDGVCGETGTAAAGTVTIVNECYFAGEVNYVLYGIVNRLCHEEFGMSGNSKDSMLQSIDTYRATQGGGAEPRKAWATTGWDLANPANTARTWTAPSSTRKALPACVNGTLDFATWRVGTAVLRESSSDVQITGAVMP